MGNQRQFNKAGGFSENLYETLEKYGPITINGITAKVVRKKGDNNGQSGLPTYTNTSNMYFKEGPNGDIIQGRYYYKNRKASLDFDWAHEHYNDPKKGGDGKRHLFLPFDKLTGQNCRKWQFCSIEKPKGADYSTYKTRPLRYSPSGW